MVKNRIDKLVSPLQKLISIESSSGIVLLICTAIAMILSNSPWREEYHALWDIEFTIGFGQFSVSESLHYWINDGLMAMFFFVVGLEMKREIIGGQLSSPRKAVLPIAAAAGGMAIPAFVFLAFNHNLPGANGWGIPMATDIAFALAILSLLGNRVPYAAKIFLTTLAIADDLGAVLVIAINYSSSISLSNLAIGAVFMGVLLVANYLGVRNTLFYGLVGIGGLWLAFLLSGVHATVAGVLAALAIPARTKIDETYFSNRLRQYVNEFDAVKPNDVTLLEPEQLDIVEKIQSLTHAADTPLQRLEHILQPVALFVVMPVFALANAGITLDGISAENIVTPMSSGVFLGLLVGKFTGIAGVCWLFVKLKWASLPDKLTFKTITGISLLGGVGFTMSLFITNLAFQSSPELVLQAKLGILAASLLAGLLGYLVLRKN